MIIEKEKRFKLTWLKWLVVLCSLLIIGIMVYSVYLYYTILKNKETDFLQSEEIILEQTNLTTIEKVERFHGDTFYHVITGLTRDGDIYFAYLPKKNSKKKQKITLINHANILPKSQIKANWLKTCESCYYVSMTPGLIDERPVWEMTYKDGAGRYVFDYLSMYDGESVEQFRFKRFIE
ncbi:MAG TPA: DUF5590 domain-containing protein [Cerasibacillus sp.]|uniref:cell wall elongation regulator TseB-like domain-containing protein n=1 Tax=Cerasibacillus sp. TaxID=2498711 RepID=UPI002F41F289